MIFEYLIIWHKTSLLGREWLHIGDQGTLFCNICIQHGKSGEKNPFVQGCTSHKKDSIISHEKSRYHLNAVKAKQMKELPLGKSPAEKVITTLHAKDEEKLTNLFINCHGLAYQGRPYTDFMWLLKMDKKKKVNVGDTYGIDKKAREFTKAIPQIEREKIIDHIASSKFSAVLVDGSSDVSVIENEIVYVRICSYGNPKTMFIHSAQVARGQAQNIMEAIQRSITTNLMTTWDDFIKTMIAMGSDGESVMLGSERGVASLMKKNAPWLVAVHCYGHRLELAFKDVIKKVPLLERMNVLLYGLFYFYHRSPLNRANLKAAYKAAGVNLSLVPIRVGGTRWVGHVLNALMNVIRAYPGIVLHLQQLVGNQIGSVNKDQQAKAKAYLKMLQSKDMVYVMHFMIDVLSVLKKVSNAFQERDATAADIHTQLSSVCAVLEKYQSTDGPHLSKVNSDDLSEYEGVQLQQQGRQCFQSTRHSVLINLQMAMERRFDDSKSGVLSATQIVNLSMWPSELEPNFGDSWVKTLAEHFEKPLKTASVDGTCCR